jgi:hypothetical protein
MGEAKFIETYDRASLYEVKSNIPGISFIQYKEYNRNPNVFRAFAELEEFSFQTGDEVGRKKAIDIVKNYLDNR